MAKRRTATTPTLDKNRALERDRVHQEDSRLTTDTGLPLSHTDDSLKAGARGPSLLEDFHLREKITRFDHERIPERVVHARGSAAHGFFQVYEPMGKLCRAGFLQDPSVKTPVFVRFSTVAGSRGSADTVRDVRGFAVKFYTEEGNFDLVGNNIPVFFIQDGIKFPDFVHSVKPEPHNEMPQAASAHDSFWDFVSLQPEAAHMVMWAMSDRAIPRSYRMMEGFGVHTFRMVNQAGKSKLVKFHWKPLLGMRSLVWDEAQKIAGKDPDFHRRDLWDAIESGAFPSFELGVQVMNEGDDLKFGFDLLDPTKLVPEELVPVQRIGKLTLDRNPDNFFAETEQVAFHVGHLVPGIDVTNDPLMQARLFSYLDTQLTRLGGPNHAELPINRPLAPVHNHQQDGFGRQRINTSRANYHPNSIGGGCPMLTAVRDGGFASFPQAVEGPKTRERAESFADHFSQATMFLLSQSPVERRHLTDACCFEVSKVASPTIRERVIKELLAPIDARLAADVASAVGVSFRAPASKGADKKKLRVSPALSMESSPKEGIATRQVAVLAANGVAGDQLGKLQGALERAGAVVSVVAPTLGAIKAEGGGSIEANKTFLNASSVLFDAIYVPGGRASVEALKKVGEVSAFLTEAYRHYKPIGATAEGVELVEASLRAAGAKPKQQGLAGVVLSTRADGKFASALVAAIAAHRHWARVGAPD